jgi:hypothetical protein
MMSDIVKEIPSHLRPAVFICASIERALFFRQGIDEFRIGFIIEPRLKEVGCISAENQHPFVSGLADTAGMHGGLKEQQCGAGRCDDLMAQIRMICHRLPEGILGNVRHFMTARNNRGATIVRAEVSQVRQTLYKRAMKESVAAKAERRIESSVPSVLGLIDSYGFRVGSLQEIRVMSRSNL